MSGFGTLAGPPPPTVLFAGDFIHPPDAAPPKAGGNVDEITFHGAVVVKRFEVVPVGHNPSPQALPQFQSVTQAQPFQLEVFYRPLGEPGKPPYDWLLPKANIQGGGTMWPTADVVTNHVVIRGHYQALSVVLFGTAVPSAQLPPAALAALQAQQPAATTAAARPAAAAGHAATAPPPPPPPPPPHLNGGTALNGSVATASATAAAPVVEPYKPAPAMPWKAPEEPPLPASLTSFRAANGSAMDVEMDPWATQSWGGVNAALSVPPATLLRDVEIFDPFSASFVVAEEPARELVEAAALLGAALGRASEAGDAARSGDAQELLQRAAAAAEACFGSGCSSDASSRAGLPDSTVGPLVDASAAALHWFDGPPPGGHDPSGGGFGSLAAARAGLELLEQAFVSSNFAHAWLDGGHMKRLYGVLDRTKSPPGCQAVALGALCRAVAHPRLLADFLRPTMAVTASGSSDGYGSYSGYERAVLLMADPPAHVGVLARGRRLLRQAALAACLARVRTVAAEAGKLLTSPWPATYETPEKAAAAGGSASSSSYSGYGGGGDGAAAAAQRLLSALSLSALGRNISEVEAEDLHAWAGRRGRSGATVSAVMAVAQNVKRLSELAEALLALDSLLESAVGDFGIALPPSGPAQAAARLRQRATLVATTAMPDTQAGDTGASAVANASPASAAAEEISLAELLRGDDDDAAAAADGWPPALVRLLWEHEVPAALAAAAALTIRGAANGAAAPAGSDGPGLSAAAARLFVATRAVTLRLLQGRGDSLAGALVFAGAPPAAKALVMALEPSALNSPDCSAAAARGMSLSDLEDLGPSTVTPAALARLMAAQVAAAAALDRLLAARRETAALAAAAASSVAAGSGGSSSAAADAVGAEEVAVADLCELACGSAGKAAVAAVAARLLQDVLPALPGQLTLLLAEADAPMAVAVTLVGGGLPLLCERLTRHRANPDRVRDDGIPDDQAPIEEALSTCRALIPATTPSAMLLVIKQQTAALATALGSSGSPVLTHLTSVESRRRAAALPLVTLAVGLRLLVAVTARSTRRGVYALLSRDAITLLTALLRLLALGIAREISPALALRLLREAEGAATAAAATAAAGDGSAAASAAGKNTDGKGRASAAMEVATAAEKGGRGGDGDAARKGSAAQNGLAAPVVKKEKEEEKEESKANGHAKPGKDIEAVTAEEAAAGKESGAGKGSAPGKDAAAAKVLTAEDTEESHLAAMLRDITAPSVRDAEEVEMDAEVQDSGSVAPARALEAVRHLHLLVAATLPALRLLRRLLAALAAAGARISPPRAEKDTVEALLDLSAALAGLPTTLPPLGNGDGDDGKEDERTAAEIMAGPTPLVALAARSFAATANACSLWCPPNAWAVPAAAPLRRGGILRGSFVHHAACHALAAPAHHLGGLRLLAALLPGEGSVLPRGFAANLLPPPGLGTDYWLRSASGTISASEKDEDDVIMTAAPALAALALEEGVGAAGAARGTALMRAEAATRELFAQWDVALTLGMRFGGRREEAEREAAAAEEADDLLDEVPALLPSLAKDPLRAVAAPAVVNAAAVIAILGSSSAPPLVEAAAAAALRVAECGPRAARAVAAAQVRQLVGAIERYVAATQAGAGGKDAPGWEDVYRALSCCRALASGNGRVFGRPGGGAGRVALLAGGAMEALVPCLGLPKPEIIRLALDVLSRLCGVDPSSSPTSSSTSSAGDAADVRRYSRPPMPFATLVTAVRNVVAKWHRVDLFVHAAGARLLARLGADPSRAREVLQGLWPRGGSADKGEEAPGDGRAMSMLLPRLLGGLQKGFEDLSARYRNRMLLESEGGAAAKKGDELDRRALRLARAACWALQVPLSLMTEGLVDASEVHAVLAPQPASNLPPKLAAAAAAAAAADEPLAKLRAAVDAFLVFYRAAASPLEAAAAANGDRRLLLRRLALRQYLSALVGSIRELAAACDAVRGSKPEPSAMLPRPPQVKQAPLEHWFAARSLLPVVLAGSGGGSPTSTSATPWADIEAAARAWFEPPPRLGFERLEAAGREDDVTFSLFFKTEDVKLTALTQRESAAIARSVEASGTDDVSGAASNAAAAAFGRKRRPALADFELRAAFKKARASRPAVGRFPKPLPFNSEQFWAKEALASAMANASAVAARAEATGPAVPPSPEAAKAAGMGWGHAPAKAVAGAKEAGPPAKAAVPADPRRRGGPADPRRRGAAGDPRRR